MKALALFSGGLDSMLAIKLITDQGIDVVALHMDTGFGVDEEKFHVLKRRAELAGAKFKVVDIKNKYLQEVLFTPKFGYGKQFNPCIDCHGHMFKVALAMLEEESASFVITGEVIGQRPMSQRREALNQVKKLASDDEDLVLRPMCAKLLNPTKPEREGWVDREKLLDFSGRDRKPQLALAKEFGFKDYATPGGGCLLTVESFAVKIKEYLKFDKDMRDIDVTWLKLGRHLRLKNGAKMVIGRDENDNKMLLNSPNDKFHMISFLDDIVGAVSFIDKNADDEDLNFACRLALAYTKAPKDKSVNIKVGDKNLEVIPFEDKAIAQNFFVK
ncbi:putative tRNA(5-methylaminomethyl-2-thiouridylate) methyltransferase [Campylobacter pinnipediorum subsp. pinnipediorum]|uniref:argininosuccinate synthase domain-containing protein n=1 Tax=Campylobacter pinnipediorum TaxID=1965231 RepID=UPI000994AD79|nr:argininosuccinate synthase domain-containing protein [Campylobacter pinnipediorum]AQW82056.1 putative tRNA(5-methylaminomethyl-2-thiouridylate) methyltransferase [Campylobacter pinnipediorum subsp. pinnipediorum]